MTHLCVFLHMLYTRNTREECLSSFGGGEGMGEGGGRGRGGDGVGEGGGGGGGGWGEKSDGSRRNPHLTL